MNTLEYISSGILESYVLGSTTAEETKEVEKYAAMYPDIKSEVEEIEKIIFTYATEHSTPPPSYLKGRILKKIQSETNTTRSDIKVLNQTSESRKSNFSFWSIAASFLVLLSAGFTIYFGTINSKLDNSLTTMTKANAALLDSIRSISSSLSQMQNDLAILKDPMYKIVELKGLKTAPEAKAMVCWCPADKKVYVEIDKLPPAPQGMQYQLWAIVDGKPVSEGMLAMGNGLHAMKDVDNAQAFAVTLEKQGGSPTPKGEMYVMGTI